MAKWSEATQVRKSEEFIKVAAQFAGMDLQQLEASYSEVRKAKEELELKLKPVNVIIMVLEILFAEKYAEEGLKTVKFDNGDRITVGFETNYSIEDKESFINWLKTSGHEFELTVYAATAAKIVKEELAVQATAGVENPVLPPGIRASDPVPKVTYTPSK